MALCLLYGSALTSVCDHWEHHSLYYTDLCQQSNVSAFQHTMFVIAFLPRSNRLLISWLQSPSTVILKPKKRNSVSTSMISPSICHAVMGPYAMILGFFLTFSLKPALSLSLHLIKSLFRSSLLSAIGVVSSTYLRWLIFLQPILILAYNSSSPAFRLMGSGYKLNKQGDNIQPCHTTF